jgi:hypothetical protein
MKTRKIFSLFCLYISSIKGLPEPIIIDSSFVQATDGLFPVVKPASLLKRVQELLAYNYGKGDHIVSIEEIAAHEHLFDSLRHEKLLAGCINNILFIMTQEPNPRDSYLKDFRMVRQQLAELIMTWAQQRKRSDTPLKTLIALCAQTGNEQEVITNSIKSLTYYYQLLVDAEIFLTDLLYSYPKSYALYQTAEKIVEHNRSS